MKKINLKLRILFILGIALSFFIIVFSIFSTKLVLNDIHRNNIDLTQLDEFEIEIYQETQQVLSGINQDYMMNVKDIFQKSCHDCHSNKPVFPWYYKLPIIKQLIDDDITTGLSHLDMSNDYPFDGHGSFKDDLIEIAKVVKEGKMPPKNYLWLHADANLNQEDRVVIIEWVTSSLKIIELENIE